MDMAVGLVGIVGGVAVELEIIRQVIVLLMVLVEVLDTGYIKSLIMVDMHMKDMECKVTLNISHIIHMTVFTIQFTIIVFTILCTMYIMIIIMLFTMSTILHIQFNMTMAKVDVDVMVVIQEEDIVIEEMKFFQAGLIMNHLMTTTAAVN